MFNHPRSRRSRRLFAPLVLTLVVAAIAVAPSALAASTTVVGTISPTSVPAGATRDLTFTLRTTSGQVSSFNLTAPAGFSITNLTPQAGVTLNGSQIQGRNITATSSTSLSVAFSVQAPCSASSTAWTLVARTGGGFTGQQRPRRSQQLTVDLAHGHVQCQLRDGPVRRRLQRRHDEREHHEPAVRAGRHPGGGGHRRRAAHHAPASPSRCSSLPTPRRWPGRSRTPPTQTA